MLQGGLNNRPKTTNQSKKVVKINIDYTATAARFRRTSSSAAAIAFFDSLSLCHSSLDRLMMNVFGQMVVKLNWVTVLNLVQCLLNEIQRNSVCAVDSLGVLGVW